MEEETSALIKAIQFACRVNQAAAERTAQRLVRSLAAQIECEKVELTYDRIKVWAEREANGKGGQV